MPELPEVETIRSLLSPGVKNQCIEKVVIRLPRLLEQVNANTFKKAVQGKSIVSLTRRGKYLLFELPTQFFVIHLGMTGQLIFTPKNFHENRKFIRTITGLQRAKGVHPVDKHTHIIFYFSQGSRMLFRDTRTFGKIFLTGKTWWQHPRLAKLGPEPLDINLPQFVRKAKWWNSCRPIKALLLDQSVLAGIGNIYADEALFRANIHPLSPVNKLTRQDILKLLRAARVVLKKGIRNAGTSFSDYMKPDGTEGRNFEKLMVYGRAGQKCRKCGDVLQKILVAQRGTVFCPHCQPVKQRIAPRTRKQKEK